MWGIAIAGAGENVKLTGVTIVLTVEGHTGSGLMDVIKLKGIWGKRPAFLPSDTSSLTYWCG